MVFHIYTSNPAIPTPRHIDTVVCSSQDEALQIAGQKAIEFCQRFAGTQEVPSYLACWNMLVTEGILSESASWSDCRDVILSKWHTIMTPKIHYYVTAVD